MCIINTSIEGERLVLEMNYLNVNTAINVLTKQGYIFINGIVSEYVKIRTDKQELKINKTIKEFYERVLSEVDHVV